MAHEYIIAALKFVPEVTERWNRGRRKCATGEGPAGAGQCRLDKSRQQPMVGKGVCSGLSRLLPQVLHLSPHKNNELDKN